MELEQQRLQLEQAQAVISQLRHELRYYSMVSSANAAGTSRTPQHVPGNSLPPSHVSIPPRPVATLAITPADEEMGQTWKARRRAERNKKHRERQKAKKERERLAVAATSDGQSALVGAIALSEPIVPNEETKTSR